MRQDATGRDPAVDHAASSSTAEGKPHGLVLFALVSCAIASVLDTSKVGVSSTAVLTYLLTISFGVTLLYRRRTRLPTGGAALVLLLCWTGAVAAGQGLAGRDGTQTIVLLLLFWMALRVAEIDSRANADAMHGQLDRGGLVGFLIIGGMVVSQVGGVGSHLGPRVLSLTMLPFALVLLLSPLRLRRLLGLMGIAMVALTLSRMAFVIGAVVSAVVYVFRNRRRRTMRITITFVALVVAYAMLSRWGAFSSRWVTGDTSFRIAGFRLNASGRTRVWSALYESAWESPLVGHGLGSSRAATEAVIPGLDHPHNEYLRLFFELGIPGVLLFCWFIVRRAQVLASRLRNRVGERRFVLGALCALLGLTMAMASDNPLVYVTFLIPMALLIGAGEPMAAADERAVAPPGN